ncbi:PilZ domain-containing protein [Acuticoccus sp. M5D2P5]|uniref:PilZ domain-containing protein n=1 Tax=Acuticoccus kalidii TaxID=2910977 RepID=UPI001F2F6539|nr:PilZ domain-containing protein [Acuticoccus kalidii]MCF3931943.1 PilZ domain-containing protein [Acuticoccus kalidii]
MTESTVGARLRRRRARDDEAMAVDRNEPQSASQTDGIEYGYGGWTVTLDNVPMPSSEPQVVKPSGTRDAGEARMRARGRREGGRQGRDRTTGRADISPTGGEANAANTALVAAAAAASSEPPVEEDRPIIAATPRRAYGPEDRARTVPPPPEPDLRREQERANALGARNRTAQRIEGGGTVIIENQLFPLVDWSNGGIAIRSDGHFYRIGDVRTLELEIDLGDYAVNMDIDAEVANRSSERTGWRFINPSEEQRQVLRALTQVSLQSKPFAAPRRAQVANAAPATAGAASRGKGARTRRPRGVGPLTALMSLPFNLAVIGLVAGVAILTLAADKTRTESGPAGPVRAEHAAVAVERVAVWAGQGGVVLDWAAAPGEAVDRGATLVTLANDLAGSEQRTIISPCECYLARILADPGERVVRGQTLGLLYQQGAEGHVQALFAAGSDIAPGQNVSVDLPYSGRTFDGVVVRVGHLADPKAFIGLPAAIFGSDPGAEFARIRTTPSIPAALAGDPAVVTLEPGG